MSQSQQLAEYRLLLMYEFLWTIASVLSTHEPRASILQLRHYLLIFIIFVAHRSTPPYNDADKNCASRWANSTEMRHYTKAIMYTSAISQLSFARLNYGDSLVSEILSYLSLFLILSDFTRYDDQLSKYITVKASTNFTFWPFRRIIIILRTRS